MTKTYSGLLEGSLDLSQKSLYVAISKFNNTDNDTVIVKIHVKIS